MVFVATYRSYLLVPDTVNLSKRVIISKLFNEIRL